MNILGRQSLRVAFVTMAVIAAIVAAYLFYIRRPIAVEVASIEKNVPIRVFGLGTVEARVISNVGFEVKARLIELHADHGDQVSEDQVLARLNRGEQKAKLAKARAAKQIAEVNIERAKANLEKARAVFDQKQADNRRKQELRGRDVVSADVAEKAARDAAVAQADVAVAESELSRARAQLTDAKAQVQLEETLVRQHTLRAPYDALVIERSKELGTVINTGEPIFKLMKSGTHWGLAYVDEARAGLLEVGQHVHARMRSRPQETFTGEVVRIGLESDPVTEERRVYVKGDDPPPRVYLGEQVEFWITVATLDEALLVPQTAVHGYDGRAGRVWTVEDGRLQRREVEFRHRTEDARLEIVDGLPKDARVVTKTSSNFRDGRAVRISGDSAQ